MLKTKKPEKAVKAAPKKKLEKAAKPKSAAKPAPKPAHKPVKPAVKPKAKAAPVKALKTKAPAAVVAPAPVQPVKVAPALVKPAPAPVVHAKPAPVAPVKPVVAPFKPAPVAPVVHPKPVVAGVAPVKPAPIAAKPIAPVPAPVAAPIAAPLAAPAAVVSKAPAKEVELTLPISVKDLSIKLQEKPSVLIKVLMGMKVMAGINQMLDETVVTALSEKFNFKIVIAPDEEELALAQHNQADSPQSLRTRSPIVTFMGHVDHGKTSLMDAIRKTKIAEHEHGGITQHIGAYRVSLPHGEITFLDTPGHEAFTAMRARGASVTDIVVLVVAADDGVMPQTREAIDHARAAGVPIIVALNKIDKASANPDTVKKQLGELDLLAEDWGGKTITAGVSAKTGEGIDNLLEMILLEAQMLELKADPNKMAKGVVLEAKISPGRGITVTLLIQGGTLYLNEHIVVGNFYGKIRAMTNHLGKPVTAATPGVPVEVLGIAGVPPAGEQFYAFADEKAAKELALRRLEKGRHQTTKTVAHISLEELHAQIAAGKIKELKLILKADVQGSLGAIKDVILKLAVEEIKISFIHEGVGDINTSDVVLAAASNALILGFHVAIDDLAKEVIAREGIDVRIYNIIYELGNEIKAALEGMLEPRIKKNFVGRAEVRKVMKLTRSGIIAGCYVSKGKITRNALVNLVRNGEVVFDGKISSLRRFKDDVKEVAEGFECGIALGGFDTMQEGDIIEAFEIEKIARKL